MPLFLEYDKTNGIIKRILTSDETPTNIAYLAYQEIPEEIEIDLSLNIEEVIKKLMIEKNEKKSINPDKIENDDNKEPEIIEV